MPLPVPDLDDRSFQDLVNEARRRIPLYCPEWTDHNLSDPGITLIELFAWMTEVLIYRLNKVPDKNYVKFLELLGVRLTPAAPASGVVTFRLTAAQEPAVVIPKGTEVATVRTEAQEAIVFATTEDLTITPPVLDYFLLSRDHTQFEDRLPLMRQWEDLAGVVGAAADSHLRHIDLFPWSPIPEPDNSFYLGFSTDLRSNTLVVNLECEETVAVGINPSDPPLLWEYWDGAAQDWLAFDRSPEASAWLEADNTQGLNEPGQIIFHVPSTASLRVVELREGYWIRCRITPFTPEQGSYESSPQLRSVSYHSAGGSVMAHNAIQVVGENLGASNGKPGQTFGVSQVPMLALGPGETVEVEREDNTGWEQWEQVEDFSQSTPNDKHFVCDPVAGEIQFGPSIRSPNGEDTRYGAIISGGLQVRLSSYRFGGGFKGNVGRGTLTVTKSSIPYVAAVSNRRAATGGVEPENIENAKLRGPQTMRTRNRAVTAEDFEFLAQEASPSVGRARCVQPEPGGAPGEARPGVVQVLLVPALPADQQQVSPEELRPPAELLQQVKEYLDQRRLLTTALVVSEPDYRWVSVEARVRVRAGADSETVRRNVEEKLYRFIHPVQGGPDGTGWPFGRDLFVSELYSQIQSVPGVEYTEELSIFPVDIATGERGEAAQTLTIPPTSLLCSHAHTVTCVSGG